MVLLGGEKAWKVFRAQGSLAVSLQWLNGEPAMFVYPLLKRPGAKPPGAFVVPLDTAYRYVKSNGHPDLDVIIPAAYRAAEVMQILATPAAIRHIVDAVCDAIPDLLAMPPEPVAHAPEPEPVGDLSLKIDGQTVLERAV
jgi:hypothetical protein